MEFINWNIAKHPMNWVILPLMILFWIIAIDLVIRFVRSPRVTPEV